MTEADRVEFNVKFLEFYNLFDKPMNQKTTDLYFDLLLEYDLELVVVGIDQAMRSCKFFPKPAEIIEIIEGKENEHIDFAYQEAKALVYHGFHYAKKFQNAVTMQVIADMGGQHEFYNRVYVNGENDTAAYFEFKRIYQRYYRLARAGHFQPVVTYLPGYMDVLPGAAPVKVSELSALTYADVRRLPSAPVPAIEDKQSTKIENKKVLELINSITNRRGM